MNKEIAQFLSRIRWLAIAVSLGGIALVFVGEYNVRPVSLVWGLIISHLGLALLIAGIIGLILELTEMKTFFEERLKQLLTSANFLNLLEDEALREYVSKAIEQMIRKRAKNVGYYDYKSLPFSISRDVLSWIGGVYCEDYNDATEFNILSPEEVEALGLTRDVRVSKTINRVTYDLIAPGENEDTEVTIKYDNNASETRALLSNQQFQLRLFLWKDGTENEREEEVDVNAFVKSEDGDRLLDFTHKPKFQNWLRCRIECTCYETPLPRYAITYMKYPTRNVTVHFASNTPVKPVGEIWGMVPDYTPPFETEHALTLRYPGWILEDQGYVVVWQVD